MSHKLKVVFDCNVFLQALANPGGPAGRCVELAITGRLALYISPHVLDEIRDVTSRPKLIAKFRLRPERVDVLLRNLPSVAVVLAKVPEIWVYERDPDDAHYVNLALAAEARLIVSRDNDLPDLVKGSDPASRRLLAIQPDFRVLTPPSFLSAFQAVIDDLQE